MSESWIVGINPVAAALDGDASRVRELLVEHGARNPRLTELMTQANKAGISVSTCQRERLEQVSAGARHQGVAARFEESVACDENDLPALAEAAGASGLFLVLDGVTDPHNLGACLRSAAAAKVTAVIVPKDRAVGMTPVVRRAAAGGAERVPLIVVTNLARSLRELKDAGVWLTGLAGESESSLYSLDFSGACALVMGGEGEGMRRLTRETCDYLARIPMPGEMESLNVSVATGVALFEVVRQRSSRR